jgi:molybdopterin-containing oxidoreductase family iron-sulfur binding subunit
METERPAESWNPEVTVRGRGVMEKCTYCIQRIRTAQIDADREDRQVRDGEIVTACQQSCPTQAIIFGDRNDLASAVARRKASPLDYVLLEELNTRPRTSYAALIRNLNPQIDGEKS